MERIKLPAFTNEAEEAAWWFENREKHAEEFVQAFERGEVTRGGLAQRLNARKIAPSLTLNEEDAKMANTLAQKKGVALETLLTTLIHQALEREMAEAA